MTREEIFAVVKKNVREVLFDVEEEQVTMTTSLQELGANSVDRVDIIIQSMEQLDLTIGATQLTGVTNLEGLVDLFYENIKADNSHRTRQ